MPAARPPCAGSIREDLLGELGELLKADNPFGIDPNDLTQSVSAGLGKLDGLVQLPHLPLLGDVLGGLERLVALLEDAFSKFGGGGEIDLDRLLPDTPASTASSTKCSDTPSTRRRRRCLAS
ncbi:MAG: hypothetical protein QM736_22545 [Vicinamibacterales bacterium]